MNKLYYTYTGGTLLVVGGSAIASGIHILTTAGVVWAVGFIVGGIAIIVLADVKCTRTFTS